MRRILTALVAAAALSLATPLAAIADDVTSPVDGPVSDHMASQDPEAYGSITMKPCATRRSLNCYWDVIGHTGRAGQSYFVIRVGRQACIRYWEPAYNRAHGHCVPVRHWKHRH